MANPEHVEIVKQGKGAIDEWRQENEGVPFNLQRADLQKADLRDADLREANLYEADLRMANLIRANLCEANLTRSDIRRALLVGADLRDADIHRADLCDADLRETNLYAADLRRAKFIGADLIGADLREANLLGADLRRSNLRGVTLFETLLADVNLSQTRNLDTCDHFGPSAIDHRTLEQSGVLPQIFLRGCGLPDKLIDYLPSLLNQPIQFYSCFISYSSMDTEFAERLHVDLLDNGVRCWFAPHDMPIGAKILDTLDEAIRSRDKLLLVLSDNSVKSDWVDDEVTKAFAEERRRKQVVVFPVRIDGSVLDSSEPWARKLRDNRNIGDFSNWKAHDDYRRSLERVLRDLKVNRETDYR